MTFESSYRISIKGNKIIPESGINFMGKLLTLLLLLTFSACQTESRNARDIQNPLKKVELVTPSGESIETTVAITASEQEQGLSGVKSEDYKENQGMLFYYLNEDERHFWMPDTYFDLDLFFLDKDLKIIDIIRKLPFYVGRANQDLIPRARGVWCRHTLEIRADSSIAKKLNVGDVLKWKGTYSLQETEAEVIKLLKNN
jgi:uncharacterized membrane protein (UPF0127 family)